MRARLAEAQNWRCCYCGVRMVHIRTSNGALPNDALTIEHVIPVRDGGDDTWENMAAACYWCNNRRGQYSGEEWVTIVDQYKALGMHPNFPYV